MVLLLALAMANPASQVLGLEPWRPLDGHPLFPDHLHDVSAPSGPVDADGCPLVPDEDDCADPRFWETTCGARAVFTPETSASCRVAFQSYVRGNEGIYPLVPVVDPRTGEVVSVRFEDYVPDRITWSGFSGTFDHHILALTEPRSVAEQVGTALDVVWWESNCAVQSCAEFAHEAYDDYSEFELRALVSMRDGDFGAVFDAAYGADGIARRPLYSSGGEALAPLALSHSPRSRGPLYGFLPNAAQADNPAPIIAGHTGDAVEVPYLARALGDYLDPFPGEDTGDDLATRDFLLAFDDDCDFSADTGLLECASSDPVHAAIAGPFNARLWSFEAAPIDQIPAPSLWPPAGDPWDHHQDMRTALAGVPDSQLLWLEQRMAEMGRLKHERGELWERLAALGAAKSVEDVATCDCGADPLCIPHPLCDMDADAESPGVMERLRDVDQRLTALVTVFDDAGCLAAAPTPCDWSPRRFAEVVTGHFRAAREADYRECIARTGNDFRALRKEEGAAEFWLETEDAFFASQATGPLCEPTSGRTVDPRCDVRESYIDDDRAVRSYFATLDAWGAAFAETYDFPVDPDTGVPDIGGTSSDRSEIGDGNFGVVMAYDAGWSLGGIEDLPEDLSLSAYGQLQVRTRLFGLAIPVPYDGVENEIDDADLFDVEFQTRRETGNLAFVDMYASNEDGGNAWAVFDLLGTEVYRNVGGTSDPAEGPLSFHFVANPDHGSGPGADFEEVERLAGARSTVFVGPVPLDLQIGAAGSVGVSANLTLDAVGDENAAHVSTHAIFEPSARASVFASAQAGIPGFVSAGVDADLTLVEVSLAVQTTLQADVDATVSDLSVNVQSDLRTTLLAGQVRGFVELPWEEYDAVLFRYGGIQHDIPLARTGFDADLTSVQRAFGIGDPLANNHPEPVPSILVEAGGICTASEGLPTPDLYIDFDDANVSGDVLEAELGAAGLDISLALPGAEGIHGQAVDVISAPLSLTPGSTIPSGGADRTLSMWFSPVSPFDGTLLALGTESGGGLAIRMVDSRTLEVELPCSGGSITRELDLLGEPDWHSLYVRQTANHVSLRADEDTLTLSCALTLDDDLHLGGHVGPGGVSDVQAVRLDELGIWGEALDPGASSALRTQGIAGLPLHGPGSAPLTGVSGLSGALEPDGAGLRLDLSWTLPPSVFQPGFGYDEVVVRIDPDGPVDAIDDGTDGYVGMATGVALFPPIGTEVVHVSTWARGPSGQQRGPSATYRLPSADLPSLSGLSAIPLDGEVRLTWSAPTDPRVASVRIAEGGALLFAGNANSFEHRGIPNGVARTYTVWNVDGSGRLSPPVSVVATPSAGAQSDTSPPGALQGVSAVAAPDQVSLSWTLPSDPDALQTRVRRIDHGVFRRELGTFDATSFADGGVRPETDYLYEVWAIDPSGNPGPVTSLAVRTESVPPVEVFTATVEGTEVRLEGIRPEEASEWVVVRTGGDIASSPAEGVEVCAVPADQECRDTSPPLDTPLRYTAFALLDGVHSDPAPSAVVQVSVEGVAGPDRTVFVGERVDLVADVDPGAVWSGSPNIVSDATGTWIRPRIDGTLSLTVTGTAGGAAVSDTFVLTTEAWNRAVQSVSENPFAGGHLAGEGVQELWSRALDTVAWTGDGALVAVDDVTTTLLFEGCDDARFVRNELAICASGGMLEGIDLTDGSVAWTLPEPSGLWVAALSSGVLAFVSDAGTSNSTLSLFAVDTDGVTALGDMELDANTGIPNHLALDASGGRVAVASFTQVTLFDVAPGLAAPTDSVSVPSFGTVGIAWESEVLAVTVESGGADRLVGYDTGAGLATLFDVPAPTGVRSVRADGGFLVTGAREVVLVELDGTEAGRFTATSWEPGAVARVADTIWVAATPDRGIGGDRVLVHDIDSPRLSEDPVPVFDPFAAGFSAVERMTVGEGHWAVRSFDQVVVGDDSGVLAQSTVGFTSAFELSSLLCIDEGALHYVEDVAGSPHLVATTFGLVPQGSWAIAPECTAGHCSSEGLTLACGSDVVLYDYDGTERDRQALPASAVGGFAVPAGDGLVLSSFGPSGEQNTGVWAEAGALTVSGPADVSSAGGVLVETSLLVPGAPAVAVDLSTATSTSIEGWDEAVVFDYDVAGGLLTGLREDTLLHGTTDGLIGGALVEPGFVLVSEGGQTLVDSGVGLYAAQIAPLAVDSAHHRVFVGDDLVTEVRWTGQSPLGLALQCQATTGPCDVLSFNPFTQTATVGWTAGSVPGEHALTLFAGTHRWFTSGADRIVVEAL